MTNWSCRLSAHRLGKYPSSVEKFRGSLILLEQHLRPLAPGLSRRPCSAAYALGPSVFTIRAINMGTDRASVSQAVASRGAPPLPAISLAACRCCRLGRKDLLPSPVHVSRHPLASRCGPEAGDTNSKFEFRNPKCSRSSVIGYRSSEGGSGKQSSGGKGDKNSTSTAISWNWRSRVIT